MPEAHRSLELLLALMAVCLVVIAVCSVCLLAQFSSIARRIEASLPKAERVLRDAHESLQRTKQILSRANGTARRVDDVVQQACSTVAETLDQIVSIKNRAEAFLTGHVRSNGSNGTRSEPRRRHS